VAPTIALFIVGACGAGGATGSTDGGGGSSETSSDDATPDEGGANGTADTGVVADDGGAGVIDAGHMVLDAYVGGPLPSGDAAQFAEDGCALLNVPCLENSTCCTLLCLQGVCVSEPHQARGRSR
jgi:hypothetical protein